MTFGRSIEEHESAGQQDIDDHQEEIDADGDEAATPASRPDMAARSLQTPGMSHKDSIMVQTPEINQTQDSDRDNVCAHRRARIDPTPRVTKIAAMTP